jgi:hypothetical protein
MNMASRSSALKIDWDSVFRIYVAKVFLGLATKDRNQHELPNVIHGPMATRSIILMRDWEATRHKVE